MTAASSPSMECSVNREISHAGGCRHPLYYCSRFNLPSCGLPSLSAVGYSPTVQCNSDPYRSKSLHLIFYWISFANGKESSCHFPHPLLIFSVFSRPLPTHSVYLYVPIIFRYKIFVYHNTGFSSWGKLPPSNLVLRLKSITIHG